MNLLQKYPQILICSDTFEDSLFFLEKLIWRYLEKNEKFQKSLLDKSEKIMPGLHIFREKFHLETKYYATDIEVVIAEYQIFEQNSKISGFISEKLTSVEGIIFIDQNHKTNEKLYQDILKKFNPSMQVIFRDISQHKAKSETIAEYNDEEIFIETVLDKFDKIANEFNNSASLITNEMEGIFRVFEIIECTMWSEMKKIKKNEKKEEGEKKNEIIEKSSENIEIKNKEKGEELDISKKKIKEEKNIEENDEMDNFVNLIQEMKDARNKVNNLTDQDRRNQAENILIKIIDNCKDMDDEEEEI